MSSLLSSFETLSWADPSRTIVTIKEVLDAHTRELPLMIGHYILSELGHDDIYQASHGVIDLATKSVWPLYRRLRGPFEVSMHKATLPYANVKAPIHCKGYPIVVALLQGQLTIVPYELGKKHPRATIHAGDLRPLSEVTYVAGQTYIIPDDMVHQVTAVASGTVSLVVQSTKQVSPRCIFYPTGDDHITVEQPLNELERLKSVARRLAG